MKITTIRENNGSLVTIDFEEENSIPSAMSTLSAISEAIISHLAEEITSDIYTKEEVKNELFIKFGSLMIEQASESEMENIYN